MKQIEEQQIEQVREICLTKELVIIDGQPGCGKTLFPSILATFERVEMMSYAFPLEWICMTHALGNMDLKFS